MRTQRGLSLVGFVLVAGLVAFAALVAFRVAPAVIEY